jgi:hypothetical protein
MEVGIPDVPGCTNCISEQIAVLQRCCSASCNPIAGYRKSTPVSVFVYIAPAYYELTWPIVFP